MSFKSENNNFLKFILDASFFAGWSSPDYCSDLENGTRISSLELYVTSECGQKCEYCYLHRHGDILYPPEIRDRATILHNLDILLRHAVKEWTCLRNIDIFSGEIVGTPLFFDVLDLILKYKKLGGSFESVIVPSNFSFIHDDVLTEKVQQYIDKFTKLNMRLSLSASIDGLLIEDVSRPQKTYKPRDETFYNKVFAFMQHNLYCAHPMIAACSVDKWVDNYKWFIDKCKQFDMDVLDRVMTLEVRNDDWTDEAIAKYLEFLQFYCDYHFENRYDGDPRHFAKSVLGLAGDSKGYTNFMLMDAVQIPTCSISYQLTVRLGDLAIAPCHRTAYPEFLYGRFIVKDDEIVDIEANNPVIATKILLSNQRKSHHGCDTCWNANSCIRGCFGAQYEYGGEPFMPLRSVCKLFKSKTRFLMKWYREQGIIDVMKQLSECDDCKGVSKYLDAFEHAENLANLENE